MLRWTKTTDLTHSAKHQQETWSLYKDGTLETSFQVNLSKGKPFKAIKAKPIDFQALKNYAVNDRKDVAALYALDTIEVTSCPCCGVSTSDAPLALTVFDRPYHRCAQCEYIFLQHIPTPESLDKHFKDSEHLSGTYTSLEQEEVRLREIVQPKLDWVCDKYENAFGRQPGNILDVGAGGGHFVYGAKRQGFDAHGYEINRQCAEFARNTFSLELRQDSFLDQEPGKESFDLITMWGLIEYTPNPQEFLHKAMEFLTPQGMLLVEVPRYMSASTAIQAAYPDYVFRHLSPGSHISIFSDASLATLLYNAGFRATDAWLFGMDAYELLIQTALMHGTDDPGSITQERVDALQHHFDMAQFSDDIILCAVKA